MGTRSLTKIYNEENKILITMYRQMDGYPSGHGVELTDFLDGFQVVNGLNVNPERQNRQRDGLYSRSDNCPLQRRAWRRLHRIACNNSQCL